MPYVGSKLHFTCGDHPYGAFWTKSGHLGPSDDLFRGQKARYRTYWGLKGACFCSYIGLCGTTGGAQKVLKWVSDAYLVIMGQLDPHVVFGIKFGAIQDFQRGKKCPIRVKQTPLDPPRPPKTPPNPLKPPQTFLNPIIDHPYYQLNPSSCLITL